MEDILKQTSVSNYKGYLRPVKGQENAEHGLGKYLHKASSSTGNDYFVMDLEAEGNIIKEDAFVVKSLFVNGNLGGKIMRDLESNTTRIIGEDGATTKLLQGRYVDIPYNGLVKITFTVPGRTEPIVTEKMAEKQFLFTNETVETAALKLQQRIDRSIANNEGRYQRVVKAPDSIELDKALNEANLGNE
jgi:hypothetical protein